MVAQRNRRVLRRRIGAPVADLGIELGWFGWRRLEDRRRRSCQVSLPGYGHRPLHRNRERDGRRIGRRHDRYYLGRFFRRLLRWLGLVRLDLRFGRWGL